MKKQCLLLLSLFFLLNSCNNDIDDNLNVSSDDENEEQSDIQFITEDLIVYYTGSLDCTYDGGYNAGTPQLQNLTIPDHLPQEFDLSPFLPPIASQGRQGSCTSWAITYYLKSFQEIIESGLPYDSSRIMSPAYTYNQLTKGTCEGTHLSPTLDILKEKGAASLESFPYYDYSCNVQPNESHDDEAMANRISEYKYLSGENMVLEMKTLIYQQTPIIISTFLTSEFGKKDDLGLTAYREHAVDYSIKGGCHAMLVVGYSDEYNAFKVVNSWGIDWGDNGFIWFDYAAFDNISKKEADFRVISEAIVAYDL